MYILDKVFIDQSSNEHLYYFSAGTLFHQFFTASFNNAIWGEFSEQH